MKKTDKIVGRLALPLIALAAILLILAEVSTAKNTTTDNNGYIRVINCVMSTPSTIRTQEDIEKCYKTVEKDLGIKLQRYDTSNYRK